MISGLSSIENGRASYAYACIQGASGDKKSYKARVVSLPGMIQTNGFALAIAFYYTKGDIYREVYNQIEEWLKKKSFLSSEEDLIDAAVSVDAETYRLLKNETLALLLWLKRFAEGIEKDG